MSKLLAPKGCVLAALFVGLLSGGSMALRCQQAAASSPAVVPLVPGSCATVHNMDSISLDWNPGFDPAEGVAELRGFSLTFAFRGDGVQREMYRGGVELGGRKSAPKIVPMANGFYHLEFSLPPRLSPGMYQLMDPHAGVLSTSHDRGEIKMTVSPVREHFCIAVLPSQGPYL
jgi:hypothetical protein